MPDTSPHLCGVDILVEEAHTISRTHSSLLAKDAWNEEGSTSGARVHRHREGECNLDQGTFG